MTSKEFEVDTNAGSYKPGERRRRGARRRRSRRGVGGFRRFRHLLYGPRPCRATLSPPGGAVAGAPWCRAPWCRAGHRSVGKLALVCGPRAQCDGSSRSSAARMPQALLLSSSSTSSIPNNALNQREGDYLGGVSKIEASF
jgi:hypothetical protein